MMWKCVWLVAALLERSSAQLITVAPPGSVASTGNSSSADNKLLCMAEMVSSIESSCSAPGTPGYYVALEDLLQQYLSRCFHTLFPQDRGLHILLPDINAAATAWLRAKAQGSSLLQVGQVVPSFVPAAKVDAEVAFMLQHQLVNSHNAWMLQPQGYGDVGLLNGFLPLDSLAASNAALAWPGILPIVQQRQAKYLGKVVAMPLDMHVNLLFYRLDVFQEVLNTTQPPQTWLEVLRLAALLHNRTWDGRPGNYGICLEQRWDCGSQADDLYSILAPMMQYQGTEQGMWFDLHGSGVFSSTFLTDNLAFAAALSLYLNLLQYAPPANPTDVCASPSAAADLFRTGHCAMIFGSDIFKALNRSDSAVRGVVGVGQLPGSSMVYERTRQAMVPCSVELCPFSVEADLGGTQTRVNLAPFSPSGGWVASVNAQSPVADQAAAIAFLLDSLASANSSWDPILSSEFETEPYRMEHFKDRQRWLAAGYEESDTERWLSARLAALTLGGPGAEGATTLGGNLVLDLRIPGAGLIKKLIRDTITNVTLGADLRLAGQGLRLAVQQLLTDPQKTSASQEQLAASYYSSIGATPPTPPQPALLPPAPAPPPPSSTYRSQLPWLVPAIVVPVLATMALITVVVLYEVRNSRKHKSVTGKVLAPGVGPDTSILVCALRDMTLLDAQPEGGELGQRAVDMVLECLRQLMAKHSGYESGWDPGSWQLTVAFHSPKEALAFALDAQLKLLHLPWPPGLLELPAWQAVYVKGRSNDELLLSWQDIIDPDTSDSVPDSPIGSLLRRVKVAVGWAEPSPRSSRNSFPSHVLTYALPFRPSKGSSGPSIPALLHVQPGATHSFAQAAAHYWKATVKGEEDSLLVFKGLRCSIGIHTGLTCNADIHTIEERCEYSGSTVLAAQALSQAADGGQVLLSEDTYKKLPLERLWDKHLVLHHGTAPVSPSETAAGSQALQGTLYQALSRCLEGRLAYLPPALSTHPTQQQLQEQVGQAGQGEAAPLQQQLERDPGVLLAPAGCVTVVFSYVVGTQTLLSWNADVAQQALRTFHAVGGAELRRWGGYAVEAVDGLFLAAFQSPAHAVLWALRCNELLVHQPWSRALLAHELCEEVHMSSSTPEGFQVNALLFRGLRLKTGLDRGQVLGEVHAMTGRMTYRGKVMNRAARIASAATSGQVLCSAAAWAHVSSQEEGVLQEQQLSAVSLGQSRLKGVTDNMELMLCRKAGPPKCDVQGPRHPLGEEWPWSQQAAQVWCQELVDPVAAAGPAPLRGVAELRPRWPGGGGGGACAILDRHAGLGPFCNRLS
ncbi:nucleotide cyclase [Haematococcus lacustris]